MPRGVAEDRQVAQEGVGKAWRMPPRLINVMASPPITELTDRARDIFRRVVEGYIDKRPAGRVKDARGSMLGLEPVACLYPLGSCGPGKPWPARRAAYQRGADANRCGFADFRRWHDARGRAV